MSPRNHYWRPLGTSTPKADPAGDYAFQVFDKAEALSSGATATLKAKALQLTGGKDSARAPEGRNPYGWVMESDNVNVKEMYFGALGLKKFDGTFDSFADDEGGIDDDGGRLHGAHGRLHLVALVGAGRVELD